MWIINKFKSMKKETAIIMVSVIALTISTLGFSYAAFFDISTSSGSNVITTGDLSVTFGNSSSTIINNEMVPQADAVGLASSSLSTLYLQNDGIYNASFIMSIGYDSDAFISSTGYTSGDEMVPLEFLKAAVFAYDNETKQMIQVSDVIKLSDLPVNSYDSSNTLNNEYVLFEDEIGKTSSGNNNKTYAIKVWLDEFTPDTYTNHKLYLKLNVISTVTESRMNYNVSGVLKDETGSVLPNAEINLQNGSFKTTTDSSGNYTLNDLREGVYDIQITTQSSEVINGTFKVVESTEEKIQKYQTSHTITSGDNLSKIAYIYSSTTDQIRGVNEIYHTSNNVTLVNGDSLIIPNVYIINGGTNANMANVTIEVSGGSISKISKN